MSTDEFREKFIRSYLTEEEISKLVSEARKGLDVAMPTYSNFFVGCCLLTHDGEYIIGCNIENISYTQSVHAEGCAISKAIAAGKKKFKAIAVCARAENFDSFIPCCGECRQFLNEFVNFLPIIIIHPNGCLMFEMLHELLPFSVMLGADVPTVTQTNSNYDSILFHANKWILKDVYAPTRNEMRKLLREWKFDEIHELTKDKIKFSEPGVLVGKFYTGPININFRTVQEIFEGFAGAILDSQDKIQVTFEGDNLAESLAHRIVATLLSYKKSASLLAPAKELEESKEAGYRVHVGSKEENGQIIYRITINDSQDSIISKEVVDKTYECREKLVTFKFLNEYYDYNKNRLIKEN